MPSSIVPRITAVKGFRKLRNAELAMTTSIDALRHAMKTYKSGSVQSRDRSGPVKLGAVPRQVARKRQTKIKTPTGNFFTVVHTKKPYIGYRDHDGNELLLNTLLPPGWRFQVLDRRSEEGINVWVKRSQIRVPRCQLRQDFPLVSLLHEIGHLRIARLVDDGYWSAYDQANHYYHNRDFPGLRRSEKYSISPNQILFGKHYPDEKTVRQLPEAYREALRKVHSWKIVDECYAWTWALLVLSNLERRGFSTGLTKAAIGAHIRSALHTYSKLARLTSGVKLAVRL